MFSPPELWASARVHETSGSHRELPSLPVQHHPNSSTHRPALWQWEQHCPPACSSTDPSCLAMQREGATNPMGSVWSGPWRWNPDLSRVNISSAIPWDRAPNHCWGLQLPSDGTWLTFIYYWLRSNLDQGSGDERLYISLSITRVFFTTLKTTYFILIYRALKLKRVGVKLHYFNLFLFTAYKTTSSLAAIAKC